MGELVKPKVNMGSLAQLCGYSSSDEESSPPVSKRLPLPNLPSFGVPKSISRELPNKYLPETSAVRNFPHEPGNWASYVAIPIIIPTETLEVIDLICNSIDHIDIKQVEDYHISLTRVLVLRHHWITEFIVSLEHAIHNVPCFSASFQGLSVYLNDNKTKTFIAINVQYGEEIINTIIDNIDKCLVEYNLPIYYFPRSLHLSVLWCLGNFKDELEDLIKNMSIDTTFPFYIQKCICKTGNKMFNLPFAK